MKVGILTFHNAYNYGAVLQTYATYEVLRQKGCQVEVIDYHNKRIDSVYNNRKFSLGGFIRSRHRFPLYALEKFYYWRCRKAYNRFLEKYICISDKRYNQGEIVSLDTYDAILIGSDQVWNQKITGGYDDVYWGNFNKSDSSRVVAWAACMNFSKLDERDIKYVKNHLANFHSLSVREDSLKRLIANITSKDVVLAIDPTLLLIKNSWDKLTHPVKEKNYIAVYAVRKEDESIDFARNIAEKKNKSLVIIRSNSKWYSSKENKEQCGPEDFLSYIKNAEMVVTSSFHGTVFSLIFEKEFVCPRFDGNERVENLLQGLGVPERMVDNYEDVQNLPLLEYDIILNRLQIKRKETIGFLENSLR